jgi:sugar-specific transcriptional regulator TrmB
MPTLQKLGLVEKIITTPAMFEAIPIKHGLSILMEQKIKETSELQAKTRELVKKFVENKAAPKLQEEKEQIVLIPAKEMVTHKIRDLINTAQTSIDVVTLWSRFSSAMFAYAEEYKKALRRGVKMRHITEIPEDKESLARAREIAQDFKEYLSFRVKYFRAPIKTVVSIIDKKEVSIFTSPSPELGGSPFLLSNNPCLIELAQNYFDLIWITATEENTPF